MSSVIFCNILCRTLWVRHFLLDILCIIWYDIKVILYIGGKSMKNHIMRILCLMLALVLVVGIGFTAAPAQATEAQSSVGSIQDGVTLHCWNWSFNEITANLDTIAALGYTAIQTSPIQAAKQATAEHPSNDWWVFYQPASFNIDNSGDSALGTKADFEKMCKAAHDKGLKVIVDVVANHMGNTNANDLSDAIIPDLRNDTNCWHDYSKNTSNYSDRYDVTQHCMAGLPDLNTASKKVQSYVLTFLKECIDAGADGFRFDGAKHIETPDDGNCASDFWPTVIDGAKSYFSQKRGGEELYCYGEVLDAPGGSLPVSAYTKYMSVTDNAWGSTVLKNVIGGKSSGAYSASYSKAAQANQLVIWAESHDDFAADGTNTRDIPVENVNKAWALVAARADAMGLYLARPANMSQYLGTASITGWAYPEVAAVNKFHTTFVGQSEYVAKENGIAYVERGTAGVILVNCQGNDADINVTAHNMADGTYTDAISGNTFTVSGGKISGKIGSTGIAVVYDTDSCAHATHSTAGFCTACSAQVGHSFNDKGECACGEKETVYRTVYFNSNRGWKVVNFYSWYTPSDIFSAAWPGSPMTHVEGNIYSCQVPTDIPNIIFNNGAMQTDDLVLPELSSGKNLYDLTTNEWSTYGETEQPGPGDDPTTPADPTEPQVTEPQSSSDSKESLISNPILWIAIGAVVLAAVCVVLILVLKKKG